MFIMFTIVNWNPRCSACSILRTRSLDLGVIFGTSPCGVAGAAGVGATDAWGAAAAIRGTSSLFQTRRLRWVVWFIGKAWGSAKSKGYQISIDKFKTNPGFFLNDLEWKERPFSTKLSWMSTYSVRYWLVFWESLQHDRYKMFTCLYPYKTGPRQTSCKLSPRTLFSRKLLHRKTGSKLNKLKRGKGHQPEASNPMALYHMAWVRILSSGQLALSGYTVRRLPREAKQIHNWSLIFWLQHALIISPCPCKKNESSFFGNACMALETPHHHSERKYHFHQGLTTMPLQWLRSTSFEMQVSHLKLTYLSHFSSH